MQEEIKERLKRWLKIRTVPIILIYTAFFIILGNRLFYLQIIKGEKYSKQSVYRTEKVKDFKSTRGSIYDRNHKLLAYNQLSYHVTLQDTGELTKNADKNKVIYRLIKVIEQNGGTLLNELPLQRNEEEQLVFSGNKNEELRFKKDILYKKTIQDLTKEEKNRTAQEIYDYLKSDKMFGISDAYGPEMSLKIMQIRYAQFMNNYYKYQPITIAIHVNDKVVAAIKENNDVLKGADVLQETNRVYPSSKYFASILGYTGLITQEFLEQLTEEQKKNYTVSDQVGKSGLEKVFEQQLHGKKGTQTVIVDENRRVVEEKEKENPIPGNHLVLTLDKDLQKFCYDRLEKKIAAILLSKIVNSASAGSKGVSANHITVPIYDVYYAFIQNKLIDVTKFQRKDATALEKRVYQKYQRKKTYFLNQMEQIVQKEQPTKEEKSYLQEILTILTQKKLLQTDKTSVYAAKLRQYKENKISLKTFLQFALENNCIDLGPLALEKRYYNKTELYNRLLGFLKKEWEKSPDSSKKIYYYLIQNHELTGTEICLLLFDQGVLKYNEAEIAQLKTGRVSSYSFLMQKIKTLKITPGQLGLDPCSGAVIVTDVATGKVLALVSYPSYDNNRLANKVDSDYLSQLVNSSAKPMYSRALQVKIAPGSTYKMVTDTAGLEEHVISPASTIQDLVVFKKIFPNPKCLRNHGMVSPSKALQVSCNYFFYEVGYRLGINGAGRFRDELGIQKLKKYATAYGLNEKSGIELSESAPQISNKDVVRSAIGQGTNNFTASQLARYVTTIANEGSCYNLTVVDRVEDPMGKIIFKKKMILKRKAQFQSSTWDQIHKGMYQVANESGGTVASIFSGMGVKIAAKTGTAQESKSKPDHGLFVSYAPYNEPEISLTIMMPNAYTSHNPAALAKEIYEYYFKLKEKKALSEAGSKAAGQVSAAEE